MTVTLRPYQTEALEAVRDAYRRGVRRPALQLPTGCGKTVIFNQIAEGAWRKGKRTLVLAHRDELLQQAKDKLCRIDPEICHAIGFVQAAMDDYNQPVVMASVQTLSRPNRMQRLLDAGVTFDVVIVDEAHHAAADSYQYVLRSLGCLDEGGPLLLGVSATLARADNLQLDETFQEIVYHRDMLSMIQDGYLCDLRGVSVKLAMFDPNKLKVRAGDFVASEAADALTAAEAPRHIVGAWQEHAAGRKTIVFTPTVALATEIADAFLAAGVPAENVSMTAGDTDQRAASRERFATGETVVATNAMLWTEGFDEPSVECIVIARPTKSKPLYIQMVGRGTRTHPGKQDCLVLDMSGVTDRMDLLAVPSLAGLDPSEVDEEAEQVLEEEGLLAMLDFIDERRVREGKIVAKRVNLFQRADIAWTEANPNLWALSAGDEMLLLQADEDARWRVVVSPRRGQPRVLAAGLDQGYAMGVAEEYVRTSRDDRGRALTNLVSRGKEWRQAPATPAQRDTLRGFRVAQADQPGMTKGEASDLLTAAIARRKAKAAAAAR